MGYKTNRSEHDLRRSIVLRSMEHNRSLKRLEKINLVINWSQVEEASSVSLYRREQSRGRRRLSAADALERASPAEVVPDRFRSRAGKPDQRPDLLPKKFMGLSFDQHSPDHSTFPGSGASSVQRGDEPDQQRRSSAVRPGRA